MRIAAPLPASPTRGEVKRECVARFVPDTRNGTSPLVGEAGRGVAQRADPAELFCRAGHPYRTNPNALAAVIASLRRPQPSFL